MPSFRASMRAVNTTASARNLATGLKVTSPLSIRGLMATNEIAEFSREHLTILTAGSPSGPVQPTGDGGFVQPHSFGSVTTLSGVSDVGDRFHVTVTLAGVRCFGTDDPSGTDEPYLITSVFAMDPREKEKAVQTVRIGPDSIGDVEVGRIFGQNQDLGVDIAVPGDSDIGLNIQLFDKELITNAEKARKAISDGNTAAILAGVAALTVLVPPAGAIAAGALALLKAGGLLDAFSDGIGTLIANAFDDDHLGTLDFRISNAFLTTLRDNPTSLDRRSDSIGGETFNFPQLPEDGSEAGKSWLFDRDGQGTYRPFFRVVLTEP